MYAYMAILAIFILFYSIIAGRLEKTAISGPMLCVGFGLALSVFGASLAPIDLRGNTLKVLAELTLALVLFTDAANADLTVLRRSFRLPQRLLLLGLPLTILLGFVFAALLLPELTWLEAAILATLLAPTDAALGKAVVTNPAVPDDIRDGLNVESGLNDGICVPILFVFLAMTVDEKAYGSVFGLALTLVLEEIGIGLVVGLVLTWVCARAIARCQRRGWITESWIQIPVAALSVGCFAVAQALGGSGFIAAFTGGLLFGFLAREGKYRLLLAAEGSGDAMALITWVVFGYVVIVQTAAALTWPMLAYAVLSLTVIRMVPVYAILSGMRLAAGSKLFVGWFGPRGLASVVFAVIVFDQGLSGGKTIIVTTAATIALSILLHGLTASPLANRFQPPGERESTGTAP